MHERSLEMDTKHESGTPHQPKRGNIALRVSQNEIEKRAQEAVTFARDNALKTEAVVDIRTVRIDALRRNLGLTNVAAVAAELQRRTGESRVHTNQPPETPTRNYYKEHGGNGKENIQTMLNGKENRPRWSKQSASRKL